MATSAAKRRRRRVDPDADPLAAAGRPEPDTEELPIAVKELGAPPEESLEQSMWIRRLILAAGWDLLQRPMPAAERFQVIIKMGDAAAKHRDEAAQHDLRKLVRSETAARATKRRGAARAKLEPAPAPPAASRIEEG